MSLRPPQNLTSHLSQGRAPSALEYEMMGEMAASLGRAGAKVEQTLAQLASAAMPERDMRLKAAARAVHAYFIQRELCGLRNHDAAILDYNIPRAVLIRLGAS